MQGLAARTVVRYARMCMRGAAWRLWNTAACALGFGIGIPLWPMHGRRRGGCGGWVVVEEGVMGDLGVSMRRCCEHVNQGWLGWQPQRHKLARVWR